jgi:hypothetical protein
LLVSSLVLISSTQARGAGAAPAKPAAAATDKGEDLNIAGKRARIVGRSALYGFGGGLVVGLASQVFKQKPKNILLFGSVGLYAGIALGVFVISTSSTPAPYEGPDTYDDFSQNQQRSKAPDLMASREDLKAAKADLKVSLLNLEF